MEASEEAKCVVYGATMLNSRLEYVEETGSSLRRRMMDHIRRTVVGRAKQKVYEAFAAVGVHQLIWIMDALLGVQRIGGEVCPNEEGGVRHLETGECAGDLRRRDDEGAASWSSEDSNGEEGKVPVGTEVCDCCVRTMESVWTSKGRQEEEEEEEGA